MAFAFLMIAAAGIGAAALRPSRFEHFLFATLIGLVFRAIWIVAAVHPSNAVVFGLPSIQATIGRSR